LKELHLYSTRGEARNLTDAGLEALGELPNLENIGLMKTRITDAAVARSRSSSPISKS